MNQFDPNQSEHSTSLEVALSYSIFAGNSRKGHSGQRSLKKKLLNNWKHLDPQGIYSITVSARKSTRNDPQGIIKKILLFSVRMVAVRRPNKVSRF